MLKHRERGIMSAAAGIGLLNLWNVEDLNGIEKYTYSSDKNIKAGALLGLGIFLFTQLSQESCHFFHSLLHRPFKCKREG